MTKKLTYGSSPGSISISPSKKPVKNRMHDCLRFTFKRLGTLVVKYGMQTILNLRVKWSKEVNID